MAGTRKPKTDEVESKADKAVPVLLAIDPGTSCGWAIRSRDKILASGAWDLSSQEYESPSMRVIRMARRMTEMFEQWDIRVVAFERVQALHHHRGASAAHLYGGFIYQIMTICTERNISFFSVPVGTVKKIGTGSGNANKARMVEAARKAWPDWKPQGPSSIEDEADARWIAEAAVREVDIPKRAGSQFSQLPTDSDVSSASTSEKKEKVDQSNQINGLP